jgi:histidinol-phosphate/aromatic aminotransferase/cobyric acid decarboxylase-like protein
MSDEIAKLKKLKAKSGSHSPSLTEITATIGYNPVKIDYCFLSNPYATSLIEKHLYNWINSEGMMRVALESYPASSTFAAKLLAPLEGLDPDFMAVGNGAVQAIEWVCTQWEIKKMLIPLPTFSTYYELLEERHVFHKFKADGSDFSSETLLEVADAYGADSILLIHPNNPTGCALSINELKNLEERLDGKKLIIDDSFSHFMDNFESYREWRKQVNDPDITFVKSFSKDCGIAGLRLGYLYCKDEILLGRCLKNATWNLNNIAIQCAEYIGSGGFIKEYEHCRKKYISGRTEFYQSLKKIPGLEVFPSQANFFLCKYNPIKHPDLVWKLLIEDGLYVRTMADKAGLSDAYIRIACRTKEENETACSILLKRFV